MNFGLEVSGHFKLGDIIIYKEIQQIYKSACMIFSAKISGYC